MRTRNRLARHRREEKARRETEERSEKSQKVRTRRLRPWLVVFTSCVLIFSISYLLWNSSITSPRPDEQLNIETPRAAVVDGLYNASQDLAFEQSLTSLLSGAGFRVDVFRGENVTVDVLMNVGGYRVLILRVHSAIHTDGFLYLFSGEHFDSSKYLGARSSGAVREGHPFDTNESYFVLNTVFLGVNRPGGLEGSTIILMGCNGTGDSYSMKRLFDNGVKEFVAWTGYVDLSHSDEATLALMEAVYLERSTVKVAVERVMKEVGPDPVYKSVLEYHAGQG